MKWLPVMIALALLLMGAEDKCEAEQDQSADEQVVEPKAIATSEPEASRCLEAPPAVISKLSNGLTAEGFNTHVKGVQMVENNDDRPWIFIGAEIVAPSMEGTRPVWATAYIDPEGNADFVAANTMAQDFAVWQKPGGGDNFDPKFDDEIEAVKKCVDTAMEDLT